MRKRIILSVFIIFTFLISIEIFAQVKVEGYYRKDGTYVQPHYRSNPDGNPYNNWSFPGNTNPYTGKTATGNEETYLENYYDKNNNSSDHSYYNNYSSPNYYYDNSSTYSFSGSGNIIIYTDCDNYGNIDVYVDGNYAGTLEKYFYQWSKPSDFGDEGTISIEIDGGYHTVDAINSSGTYWSTKVAVYGNVNNLLKLSK